MLEALTETPQPVTAPPVVAAPSTPLVASSRFKYYIHDGIEACRLELLGNLTAAELPELRGCWRTAKTTLGTRKLILDLRALKAVDEPGRQWVTAMQAEGASCLPASFFQSAVLGGAAVHSASEPPSTSRSRLMKLLAILRILRLPSPSSSTQAQ